jgi:hypothetical protein
MPDSFQCLLVHRTEPGTAQASAGPLSAEPEAVDETAAAVVAAEVAAAGCARTASVAFVEHLGDDKHRQSLAASLLHLRRDAWCLDTLGRYVT